MQGITKIRRLMPPGFVNILAESTGLTDPAAISKLVNHQQYKNKHWPAVLELAEKTNPQGFALWSAANPEKLLATTTALVA